MRAKILSIFFIVLMNISFVLAEDINLSLNQKEYYFKVGENSVINLKADNSYKETINGLLSYTITQQVNQGNFQYSSSSTKSTSFSVSDGESETPISFGTSNSPMTLLISLKFSYSKDEARDVSLEGIKIHFVADESQKKNQQNKVSSSSKKAQSNQQQQSGTFAQQEQQMQQMINNIRGNQPQQNTQDRLQNNQLAQDSSALKQQMQKQIQERQLMREEFQKQLAQNPEFQREHQKLLRQEYNLTNANVDPETNNTGSFELNYQKPDGEQATLKGQMQNGQMQNIQKSTAESRQQMLEKLQQNKKFQKYQNNLQKQGYAQQNTEFIQEENKTTVNVNFINKNNNTAMIKAEIVNKTVKNVELINKKEKEKKDYLLALLILALLGVLGYFAYKKYSRKPHKSGVQEKKIINKPFDYKGKTLSMLEQAKKLYEKKKYKDAYEKAGQALRLYLSYENNLKKEITNDDIIELMRRQKKAFTEAKECFDLCSLVEFAKYQANRKDFEKIISFAKKIIG